MIKCVLCDLDGTLLTSDKCVSDKTKEAIKALRKAGILFGIATGRPFHGVYNKIKDWNLIEDIDVLVSMNGAEVWDKNSNECTTYFPLKKEWIKEIVETYLPYDFHPTIFKEGTLLTTKAEEPCVRSAKNSRMNVEVISKEDIYMEDSTKVLYSVIEGRMEEIEEIYSRNHSEYYRGFKTQADLFEFVDKRISKSYGIEQFCLQHHFTLEDVCVFGDTTNDVEMLRDCGVSICMKNGTEDAMQVSKFITEKTNDEDGVAWHIMNKILN